MLRLAPLLRWWRGCLGGLFWGSSRTVKGVDQRYRDEVQLASLEELFRGFLRSEQSRVITEQRLWRRTKAHCGRSAKGRQIGDEKVTSLVAN